MIKHILFGIFIASFASVSHAQTETINWYNTDGTLYTTTTCESGGDIVLPTAPTKKGHVFQGWASYTPIEYLESNGRQYVNTLFKPSGYTYIKIDGQFLTTTSISWMVGIRDKNSCIFSVGINSSLKQYIFGYNTNIGNNMVPNITQDMQRHLFELNKGACYLDSEKVYQYTTSDFQSTFDLFLFGINSNQNRADAPSRIYYAQIYDNNVLVRDFIPVLDSNDIPCLYDKVQQQFYYNAGTGNFVAGPRL